MSAKDMFEELDFKQVQNDKNCIVYEQYINGNCRQIIFTLLLKKFRTTYGYQISGEYACDITSDELKAVIQQAKELGWFEEEKQEIKQETNYEHFKDEIIENSDYCFALVDGKPCQCSSVSCCDCGFSTGHGCSETIKEWLKSPYKKPTYKLSQFEYDLINAYDRCKECCLLNEIEALKRMSEKGYFKGIDPFTKVHEILDNCEVIQ